MRWLWLLYLYSLSTSSFLICRGWGFTPVSRRSLIIAAHGRTSKARICFCALPNEDEDTEEDEEEALPDDAGAQDTIRVRIWRALASGQEVSLRALGATVGERRQGELRSHLQHVEKQAQTLRNKSTKWRERRGLDPTTTKLRLVTRRHKKDVYIRLK